MIDGFKLEPGERVVFKSARGGPSGHSGWVWLLLLFGGSQICGSVMIVPLLLTGKETQGSIQPIVMSALTLLAAGVIVARWVLTKIRPGYFITDRRLVMRRIFWTPVVIDLDNVASAARILVQYTRYGRVVNETLTHRVGVAFHSGGFRRFGPIKEADDFVSLLQGVAQKVIDCRALPDVDGGLAAAESRSDLLFVQTTTTAGAPRGPLFVGPTKVIGFAEPFFSTRMNQALTMAGANRSPEEIEQSMLALSQNSEFGRGRSVVMEREGLSLVVSGGQLKLTSGEHAVAFDLKPEDAERAAKFAKGSQARGYR